MNIVNSVDIDVEPVNPDLDLEHILDAGPCGDHRVQVWSRSSHVCGIRSDFRVGRKVSVSRDL